MINPYQKGMPEMACIYIWIFFSAHQGHQLTEEIKVTWYFHCQKAQSYFSTIFFQNKMSHVMTSIKTPQF